MTITELIAALEVIEAAEGGDLPVLTYNLRNEERPAEVRVLRASWRQDSAEPRGDAVVIC